MFTATNQTNSFASFTAPGNYTFMFSAANGVHTPAYDAVIVNVMPTLRINLARSGTNVALKWSGGSPPYHLERATSLTLSNWSTCAHDKRHECHAADECERSILPRVRELVWQVGWRCPHRAEPRYASRTRILSLTPAR